MKDLHRYHVNGRKKTKEEIMDSILSNYKVKCPCGHTLIIINTPKVICHHCGHYVYRSEQDEFREKMRRVLNG